MGIIPNLIGKVIYLVEVIIIIECVLSWIITDRSNEIMRTLRTITEPILKPFRELQYRLFGYSRLDLSPVFAIVLLNILQRLIYLLF